MQYNNTEKVSEKRKKTGTVKHLVIAVPTAVATKVFKWLNWTDYLVKNIVYQIKGETKEGIAKERKVSQSGRGSLPWAPTVNSTTAARVAAAARDSLVFIFSPSNCSLPQKHMNKSAKGQTIQRCYKQRTLNPVLEQSRGYKLVGLLIQ